MGGGLWMQADRKLVERAFQLERSFYLKRTFDLCQGQGRPGRVNLTGRMSRMA
jgi:hypothetical protein